MLGVDTGQSCKGMNQRKRERKEKKKRKGKKQGKEKKDGPEQIHQRGNDRRES
jgi:hypothetical protein